MKTGSLLTGLQDRLTRLGRFFLEYSRIIYFVLFLSAVIGAIVGLNLILYRPSDDAYRSEKLNQTQSAHFDTATIEEIKNLNAKQQIITDETQPGMRSNPFGE